MEEVEDDDEFPPNVVPKKKTHILELSDGSDDDEPMALVDTDNSEDEAPEESEEAELGQ